MELLLGFWALEGKGCEEDKPARYLGWLTLHWPWPWPWPRAEGSPSTAFCFQCPYLHRCGSQGDSGTGTLQTLGLLCRVGRRDTVSTCWLPTFDAGKTLPTIPTPTQALHINERRRGLFPPTTVSQGILVTDLQLLSVQSAQPVGVRF